MKLFQIGDYQYLIHLKKRYSWNNFRRKARVAPGTYSETFARGIYSSVFAYSVDLLSQYKKYYRNEYKDIGHYLFWRHGISEEILDELKDGTAGYLALFDYGWSLFDDEILKNSVIRLFQTVDGKE